MRQAALRAEAADLIKTRRGGPLDVIEDAPVVQRAFFTLKSVARAGHFGHGLSSHGLSSLKISVFLIGVRVPVIELAGRTHALELAGRGTHARRGKQGVHRGNVGGGHRLHHRIGAE